MEFNIVYWMLVLEYECLILYLERLYENWGLFLGNLNSDGENLFIYGKSFGNVFIGV